MLELNRRETAEAFEVDERTVGRWLREGCPVREQGGKGKPTVFAVHEVSNWLVRREAARYLPEDDSGEVISLSTARTRLTMHQAERERLTVEQMRGRLLDADDVQRWFGGLVSSARSRLLALPSKCAAIVLDLDTEADIEACLQDHVHEALDELSRDASVDSVPGGASDVAPTPEADGESVGGREPGSQRRGQRRAG